MDAASDTIDRQLSAAAAVVNARLVEVSEDVQEQLTRSIPQLKGDDLVVNLLAASVEGNVTTMLHILEHGIVPEELEAPAAELEYARRLAQRGWCVGPRALAGNGGVQHDARWQRRMHSRSYG